MPWWLTAIIFFFLGITVERFIIDRKFIRMTQRGFEEMNELKRQRIEKRLEEGDG
jgi:hypothetical protein